MFLIRFVVALLIAAVACHTAINPADIKECHFCVFDGQNKWCQISSRFLLRSSQCVLLCALNVCLGIEGRCMALPDPCPDKAITEESQ